MIAVDSGRSTSPLKDRRRFAVSPFREEREQRKHEAEGRLPPAPRELCDQHNLLLQDYVRDGELKVQVWIKPRHPHKDGLKTEGVVERWRA
jgi:hypothetical protein